MTDIEIARNTKLERIEKIANKIGIRISAVKGNKRFVMIRYMKTIIIAKPKNVSIRFIF